MPKAAPKPVEPKFTPPPVAVAPPDGDGTIKIVSYSELDTFRQCPLKHMFAYRERWQKPPKLGSPLSRGSLFHKLMEAHYDVIIEESLAIGQRPFNQEEEAWVLAKCWNAVKVFLFDPQTGQQDEDQELIQWMYEGYVEKYGADNDWIIIASEYGFEINLPDADGKPSPFWMKGKIDVIAVSRETGGMWIWDHKSGKDLPTQMSLEIDDQFGGYTWALQTLGYPVRGSLHNAVRTTRNKGDLPGAKITAASKPQTLDQRMKRTPLNRNKTEVANLARDFWAAAVNAYPELAGYTPLPMYSSPDPRSCSWKCDFKEMHLIARTGRNPHEVLRESGFVQNFTRH